MINIKFSNSANSVIVEPVTLSSTTVVIDLEDVYKFPVVSDNDAYFMLCLIGAGGDFEIVKVTKSTGNIFTIARAQEGTSVKEFPIGSAVEHRLTAGSLQSIIENASETVPHADINAINIGQGTSELFGHIKLTDDDTSEATTALGIGVSPYAMKAAFDKILGASTETIITASGNFTAKVAGTYRVTVIGGGGNGGSGGHGGIGISTDDPRSRAHGGGAGGGGGAGQVKVQNVTLSKDQVVNTTIGGPGGQTSFGSYVTSVGGGHGGGGSNAHATDAGWFCGNSNNHSPGYPGTGGAGGTTYGSAASTGANGTTSANNIGTLVVNNGSQGGVGGITSDGTYGNGGRGGNGGGASMIGCSNDVIGSRTRTWGGSAGQAGTQGCIKIRLAVG